MLHINLTKKDNTLSFSDARLYELASTMMVLRVRGIKTLDQLDDFNRRVEILIEKQYSDLPVEFNEEYRKRMKEIAVLQPVINISKTTPFSKWKKNFLK